MKGRELLRNIVLLFVSCAFFFVIVEAGFKILHVFSDPEVSPTDIEGLPYENTPNGWFLRYESTNGWVMYRNNSLGMRDVERTFEKPDKVKRVVCLGDSIIFGGEVAFDQIFSRQLERALNEEFTPGKIEVLNCGTTSYSLREYLIYLEKKALRFSPDLVIIGLCLNDYKSLFTGSGPDTAGGCVVGREGKWEKYVFKMRRFLLHSYFIEYLRKFWETLTLRERERAEDEWAEAVGQMAWRESEKYFVQIKEICDRRGIGMLVVIFPRAEQLNNYSSETQPQKFIRSMLKGLGIASVDLLQAYSEHRSRGGKVFSRFDLAHPLPPGHKIAADAAKEAIMTQNLFNY